ncbi:hypothetical protein VTH06DRAFT_4058 [Thermothelomyces fergusii]
MDADSLITILRAYDPSFDASAVRRALSDPAAVHLLRWAKLHITPDTLLTANELSQYAALEQSGLADKLTQSPDLTASCLLSDQEITGAIEELHRSTQSTIHHTEALRQQQEALGCLVNAGRENLKERIAVEAERAQAWQSERNDLALHTDELLQSLLSRISKLEQQRLSASVTIQQMAEDLFSSDDRLLSSLQKLGLELEANDDEEQRDVALLRETCARLIKFTVERIRTRLDRLYLEALELLTKSTPAKVSLDEVSALQEEVDSLHTDILPVARMSAEQQFLEPALKSLAAKNSQRLAKSAQAASYMHDCLDYLIDRVQDLTARLDAFQSYQLAASAVLELAKAELPTRSPVIRASPTPQQNTVKQEETDAAFQVQQNFEEAVTKHVSDGKLAMQLVHGSILAESPFRDVRLVDAEIERSITVLTQELERMNEKLTNIGAGVAKLKAKGAKRDEFISRWGS